MQIKTAVKLLEVPKKRSMTLTKGKCKAKARSTTLAWRNLINKEN